MPLSSDALELMRANLEGIRDGKKIKAVTIGMLTRTQVDDKNANRLVEDLPPVVSEVRFVGGHIYRSRAIRDGYTIEDILDQVSSAMDSASIVIRSLKMTQMENPNPRPDRYGNEVRDRAVF